MKPAYAKLAQKIAELEEQLKPQALQLMIFDKGDGQIEAERAAMYADHIARHPQDQQRPVSWLELKWAETDAENSPPVSRQPAEISQEEPPRLQSAAAQGEPAQERPVNMPRDGSYA